MMKRSRIYAIAFAVWCASVSLVSYAVSVCELNPFNVVGIESILGFIGFRVGVLVASAHSRRPRAWVESTGGEDNRD